MPIILELTVFNIMCSVLYVTAWLLVFVWKQKVPCSICSRLKPILSVRGKPENQLTSRLEKRWIICNKLSAMQKSSNCEIQKDSVTISARPFMFTESWLHWAVQTSLGFKQPGVSDRRDHGQVPVYWRIPQIHRLYYLQRFSIKASLHISIYLYNYLTIIY